MSTPDIRFHSVVAALYDPVQHYFERFQAPAHRRYLANGVDGTVLEIGVGTGAMLPYYENGAHTGRVIHGVEPDPGMWRRTREKIARSELAMELLSGRVEALPYQNDTFDYVIESGLLCSVPSIDMALDEIQRVLAPDGEFRFFDHVRSAGLVGRSQDVLTPLWRRIGGNCHLNRQVQPILEARSDFRLEALEHHPVGYWPIRTFVRGIAVPGDE